MSIENFQLIGSPNRALLAATLGFFFGAMSISLFGPTAKALTDVMGLTPAEANATLRFSSGFGSKLSDADETSNAIDFAVNCHNCT